MLALQLSKPITAHGEKLYVLEFREPTYDEIAQTGFPFTVSGDSSIRPDSAVTLQYIPLLAGIPRSSAQTLAKLDVFKASMLVLGFFTRSETDETSESDSITSPISGE